MVDSLKKKLATHLCLFRPLYMNLCCSGCTLPSQGAVTPALLSSSTAAERLKNLLEERWEGVGGHIQGKRRKGNGSGCFCSSCQGVSREDCAQLWRSAFMIFVLKWEERNQMTWRYHTVIFMCFPIVCEYSRTVWCDPCWKEAGK